METYSPVASNRIVRESKFTSIAGLRMVLYKIILAIPPTSHAADVRFASEIILALFLTFASCKINVTHMIPAA